VESRVARPRGRDTTLNAVDRWPGGARAAVSVTVDNLGEAAEIELGLHDADAPTGGHYSVVTALPIMLRALADVELRGTFFIEGVNAEIYPDALHTIRDACHEIGYHAWCHEDWAALEPAAEAANLDRGLAAFRRIDIQAVGLRPPGGRLTSLTLDLLARRGMQYCSPAGSRSGFDRVAVLPFSWEAVDVFHTLPSFAPLRKRVVGQEDAGGPGDIQEALWRAVEEARAQGTHATLVLHTWMIEFEYEAVVELLTRICEWVGEGELWAAPCCEVAAWIAEHPASFPAAPILDQASWLSPA
jgi:peptidoglycan/xylan/chitin deacetylase (PgdA/CDA1 family)